MARLRAVACLLALVAAASVVDGARFYEFAEGDWSGVDAALSAAVENQSFPGCVALVGDHTGVLYAKAFGNYTFGVAPPYVPQGYEGSSSPPMAIDTRFDMASCTKVTSTLTAVAMLYDDGFLPLEMRIADESLLGPAFGQNGKQDITVLNCLLHNAGFPPDPNPNYWDPAFGCPQTTEPHPAMDFSCRLRIYESLFTQPLDRAPGIKYVYSDISFITLSVVVGKVVRDNAAFYGLSEASVLPNCLMGDDSDVLCYFEAFVRLNVFERLGMKNTGFLPTKDTWGSCAPAENDTAYQRIQLQGQVSDGNAYALGGIAGHAGLFSTVTDLAVLVRSLLFGEPEWLVSQETMALFRTEYNHSQSSRAIGWNTNDPTVYDEGWNLSCGNMSPQTFMHTGYTGTEICADPVNKVFTILLTNRVYPDDSSASKTAIHTARQNYNNAVLAALGLARDRFDAKLRDAYAEYAEHAAPSPSPSPAAPSTVVTPFVYPLYKQCNDSWGNHVMENQTICQVGCLMSSISMALNGKNIPLPMASSHEDGHPVELARGDTVHRAATMNAHSVDASFHALHSSIDYVAANPSTLNEWLRDHNGYVDGDDLDETALPPIDPSRVVWVGSRKPDEVTPQLIRDYLDQNVIVIANVMKGHHFVLVTGYDTDPAKSDLWYVNDPGFDREYYTADEVVGWRIFLFYPCGLGDHALPGPSVPVAMQ